MHLPLGELFQYVIAVVTRYNMDESHGLGHSMRVLHFADKIAREETRWTPNPTRFVEQRPIIQAAAILHDTCDKKYRDEQTALFETGEFLSSWMPDDQVDATLKIIGSMSYSTVKKYGIPNLGEYQNAFHVVREADLLDAYDFDRSMIYHMIHNNKTIKESYKDACYLFESRVLRHEDDGLLFTKYAKKEHPILSQTAITRMYHWRRVLKYTG